MFELTISNYRCFGPKPTRLTLTQGHNALTGPNNCGKTTALRLAYDFRNLIRKYANLDGSFLESTSSRQHSKPDPHKTAVTLEARSSTEIFYNHNLNHSPSFAIEFDVGEERIVCKSTLHTHDNAAYYLTHISLGGKDYYDFKIDSSADGPILVSRDNEVAFDAKSFQEVFQLLYNCFYIPSPRVVSSLTASAPMASDISFGKQFIRDWGEAKSGDNKFKNSQCYEVEEQIRHLLGFKSFDISPSSDGNTLSLRINGRAFRAEEVGSGITQIIVCTASAALASPSFVLLDEPELHIHPSLQIDFLNAIASHSSHGVIFSTHSLGLARSVSDNIYLFTPETDRRPNEVARFERKTSLSELAGSLQYSGYSDYMANGILLVEGPTDVSVFRKLLQISSLDHSFVVLPLNGGAGINAEATADLAELRRLSENIYCIIDSEKSSASDPLSPSRKAFLSCCKNNRIPTLATARRATENYFTQRAIDAAFPNAYKSLSHYELLSSRPSNEGWGKKQNWRIAGELNKDDLKGTDLLEFIEKTMKC